MGIMALALLDAILDEENIAGSGPHCDQSFMAKLISMRQWIRTGNIFPDRLHGWLKRIVMKGMGLDHPHLRDIYFAHREFYISHKQMMPLWLKSATSGATLQLDYDYHYVG